MMTHCSRKRQRSCEDESCELMPISKRINDLHIRSGLPESSIVDNGSEAQSSSQNNCNNVCMADLNKESYVKHNCHYDYKPELSVAENPYYYHVNEILYEAHVQRLQRISKVMS